MNRIRPVLVAAIASLSLIVAMPAMARGAPPVPVAVPSLTGVTPFVDENTFLVARIAVPAIDPEAFLGWSVNLLKAAQTPAKEIDGATYVLRTLVPPAKKWVGDFGRAGGHFLYLVISADAATPVIVLVPIEGRMNLSAMADLLRAPFGIKLPVAGAKTPGGYEIDRIGDALVLGTLPTLKKARELAGKSNRVARPELATGLAEGGGGAIQVAFGMTEPLRAGLKLIGANLPAELGGEPTAVLTEKLRWATLSVAMPTGQKPVASIRFLARGDDSETAGRLKNIATALVRTAVNDGDLAKHPDKDRVLKMLEGKVTADRMEITLDPDEVKASAGILGPLALKARLKAARSESETHLKLIASAVRNYATEFGGRFPKTLEDPQLLKYLGNTPAEAKSILTNPATPDRGLGYALVQLGKTTAPLNEVLLVYETYDTKWPEGGIQAAFADGHVAEIKTEQAFKALRSGK